MTAVEWLIQEHFGGIDNCTPDFRYHIEQAKEMEKDNIEDAFFNGVELFKIRFESIVDEPNFEDYYNEKYK